MVKKAKKAVKSKARAKKPLKKKISPKKKAIKKRVIKKRPVAKKKALKKGLAAKSKEKIIGKVTHYFPHVMAAVVKLKTPLNIGDVVKFKGHTTDFTQTISSMQIDRVPISAAKKGQEIGLLVNSRVRQHDVLTKG